MIAATAPRQSLLTSLVDSYRTRNTKNAEEVLDKVQCYLAALLHNGQIVGDHTPMAKVSGGYLVTASVPETDALADRFANKWVRKRLR